MADFPSFWFTGTRPRREMEFPAAWVEVTDPYEFEDAGKDFNERADAAPIRWEYIVDCLGNSAAEARAAASVYHDFWNTYRLSQPFNFKDKYGTTWANVHIESYDRSHDAHKSWIVAVTFTLVSFKGVHSPDVPVLTGEAVGDGDSISWSF